MSAQITQITEPPESRDLPGPGGHGGPPRPFTDGHRLPRLP